MNERIVKLITEADAYAWTVAEKYVACDCCNDGEVNYLWEDAFRQKFAELMVKDFLWQLADARLEFVWDKETDEVFKQVVAKIKQHYGVEK